MLVMRISLTIISFGNVIVTAWDRDGHEAIGGTAMSMMDSSSSSKLKAILGGEDASDIAGWGHQVETSLGWTSTIHFMPQVHEWSCTVPNRSEPGVCENGRCIEMAIRHFYRQLTRGDPVKGLNVMEDDADFTDADALRFLVNLIGDLSQPLHVGFRSDEYGKKTYVRLPEGVIQTDERVVSLFDMWDSKLTQYLINNPRNPNFWWSGWTHVKNMHPVTLENEKKSWADKGIDSVIDWIKDSVDIACSKIYTDPFSSERLSLLATRDQPIQLSSEQIGLWEQQLRDRILLGGARLGILLTDILNNKDAPSAAKLRRGTAVSGDNLSDGTVNISNAFDESDEGHVNRGRRPEIGYNAGMINIGLLSLVLLVVVLFIKFTGAATPEGLRHAKETFVELVSPNSKKARNAHRD